MVLVFTTALYGAKGTQNEVAVGCGTENNKNRV
jgi:hypothetical protein